MDDMAITSAIVRTERIAAQVRSQFFARLGFPWRFEAYPLAAPAEASRDVERKAWIDELDFRCLRALGGDAEL